MLDTRFFKRIQTLSKEKDGFIYEGYTATHARSTMVLYSKKSCTPLAALILGTPDRGVLSVLTSRPSPGKATEPYFQGMLNMADQVLDLSIANLSGSGTINFNILHTPHRVSEVDPGPSFGINQVNELHANQGYTIPVDQRTGREMILAGKTKTDASGKVEKVTVGDTEKKEVNDGLYFYLSVVPSTKSPELIAKFAEGTAWKCASYIVRKVKKPVYKSLGFVDCRVTNESLYTQGYRAVANAQANILNRNAVIDAVDAVDDDLYGARGELEEVSEDDEADFDLFDGVSDGLVLCSSKGAYAPVDVSSTQAAELKSGRELEVRSGYTGLDYAYDKCSDPTVLCLSICPELKFFPLPDFEEALSKEIEEFAENELKRLLESLERVYKSEHCVIDLESEADTVILQCGHQCLNHANTGDLKKCPMCRSPVVAFVKAFA